MWDWKIQISTVHYRKACLVTYITSNETAAIHHNKSTLTLKRSLTQVQEVNTLMRSMCPSVQMAYFQNRKIMVKFGTVFYMRVA
jgi:hypothetical protein